MAPTFVTKDLAEFQAWLRAAMAKRRTHLTKSGLSRQLGLDPSTVGRWLQATRPSTPSREAALRLEDFFKTEPGYVSWLLGHGPNPAEAAEQADPDWLSEALPLLRQLRPEEMSVVEATAESLLQLREHRAPYGGTAE